MAIWHWTSSGHPREWPPPPPSFSQLPIVLGVGWMSCGLSSVQFDMFVDVILVQFTFGLSCWWDFTGVSSDVIRRRIITTNSSGSYNLPNPSPTMFPSLKMFVLWKCFAHVSDGTGLYNLSFSVESAILLYPLSFAPNVGDIFWDILKNHFFSCEENPFSYVLARVRERES